jgi:septal ring factor EnvC (AmiA/AmiB activator)
MNFLRWLFTPTDKEMCEESNIYSVLLELQERIETLESENIETTNTLYELMNSIEAVDARIDILTSEKWKEKNVRRT